MLIDELKKANMEALKSKNKNVRAILSVVINKYNLAKIELSTKGKEIADADLLGIIQKTIKELEDERAGYLSVNNTQRVEEIDEQMKTIQSYLPKMLTEEEIKNEILSLEDRSIPSVMKHFKENFAGKVDMGLVNRIARSI
ncbi:gatB/Yqey domain protein [Coprobacillus sp. CAG:826]|jgi:uncharacterized protein YqeY|nr:gatB/Yqey domain protein [Coprobacillus sp. CAG:826]